jgi:uncharacterized protein YkwD
LGFNASQRGGLKLPPGDFRPSFNDDGVHLLKNKLPFLLASLTMVMTASAAAGEAPTNRQLSWRKAIPIPAPTTTTSTTTSTTPTTTTTTSTTELDPRLTCNLPNFQQEIMNRVNQARAAGRTCGSTSYGAAPALRWNGVLFNAAGAHSTDMAANNYFSHTSQDGRNPGQRITGAGYAWSGYGENIAAGQTSAQAVVDGWLASPGHCANIMNASYADMATACVASSTSTYRTYWTMDLARPY